MTERMGKKKGEGRKEESGSEGGSSDEDGEHSL